MDDTADSNDGRGADRLSTPSEVAQENPSEAFEQTSGGMPSEGSSESFSQAGHPLADADTLAELRELLLGPERRKLEELREQVSEAGVTTERLAELLPGAVTLREEADDQLGRALSPTVAAAMNESVKTNPQPLIDAIFPVIGPAIRKAVSDALAKAVQSLNQTLEHSLSARSIKWRIEAARTGKPFAEVVLLNTLRYRVEQVFLIHRESGLLMQHVAAAGVESRDEQLVSGMFTAIADFVRDSFTPEGQVGEPIGLRTMQVGGVTVWVERGPHAVLAGAVRGSAPAELREVFQQALEDVHRLHSEALAAFEGDGSAMDPAQPILERCMVSAAQPGAKRKVSPALVIFGVAALGLIGWGAFAGLRSNARGSDYVQRLERTPGVMLVGQEHRWWGQSSARGFVDAAAGVDLDGVLRDSGIEADEVRQHWVAYPAAAAVEPRAESVAIDVVEPTLLERAAAALAPPPGVRLRVVGDTVVVEGRASHAWIEESLSRVGGLSGAGMRAYDDAGLVNTDVELLESLAGEIESATIAMRSGSTLDLAGQQQGFDALAEAIGKMAPLAEAMGYRVVLRVVGHTDATGDAAANRLLSEARAQAVADALRDRLLLPPVMRVEGAGASAPVIPGSASALEQQRNRRVTFKIELRGAE